MPSLEKKAGPMYHRGQQVRYVDHHKRPQSGEVRSVEAHWPGYSEAGAAPYLIYRVTHPTYRNGETTCLEDAIRYAL